ncbi:uncharacterized protein LOC121704961 isoform X2 [Alosa sapidissima]|uniref:uncharacterized protein LOC121704961 isoform X2 n=1 Tax=Alosa sapidissima TaxID=34773 RepID=UPI001C085C69|nr:uncharacterized protein LOC121704961 isoform X2 [Alosa sapidissima]
MTQQLECRGLCCRKCGVKITPKPWRSLATKHPSTNPLLPLSPQSLHNSSARILVGRGGSILCSPREEACVRATEKHQVPLVLPGAALPGMDEPGTEEEPRCDSIIAQEEGDESEEFSPNCMDFYLSKVSHNTRPFVGVCLGKGEDLSESQDDDCAWTPSRSQKRRKRQRKKAEPTKERWNERWREGGRGGGREVPQRGRARGDMRERRSRRILSEPSEPASSSDECPRTSRAHHRWNPNPWDPSPGRRHRFQPHRLSPPPAFADRKAPLWESPSLDSLGSLLSQSPDGRGSTDTSSTRTPGGGDSAHTHHSTQVQLGSCSSCCPSEQSPSSSHSNTPDSAQSYSLSERSSDSFPLDHGSPLCCLCPGFPGNTVSGSSTCSLDRSVTTVSSSCWNGHSDSRCFRAKLDGSLSRVCVRSTVPYTYGSTETGTTSDSCCTLSRSFDAVDGSALPGLCGRPRTDRSKDYSVDTSSLSLRSSTDATCTSTSSAYTVTRSFDSLCAEDVDSERCSDSHTNSSSTLKPRRRFDSSTVKGSSDSLCTNDDSDSSYVCMNRGKGPCLGVETNSDSRCSSSETVFRSDSSCNTVRRSFDSLCVNDESESVYVCMNGRGGSNASYSSTETARDSDSSLYSVERSLDSPYLSERVVALCTCPVEMEASQTSTERSVHSLYLSDSTTALCTCPVETEASQSSMEVYPNLYCSETDNGVTSAMTSVVTSDPSVCDSSCGVDSDSLSTSAVAEWGSVSLDDSERSASESTPGNHGNSSDSLYQAVLDSPTSSPGNSAERDSADALAQTLEAGMQLDSPAHLASHLEWVLKDLRGVVTQSDRRLVSPFFRELVRETGDDRDREKTSANEGFLFHPQKLLQPRNLMYREGQQYSLLQHIQNGSYGDVFSAVDLNTGFKCAAKKVPLCSFSWEEVGTWSGLSSPRVLQLFGAVREGPNIVLFMDLKTGSLAQLLRCRGRLPEDLSLHYHVQVLEALEHLHRRRVLHLDVKVDNVLLSEDGRDCFLCDFGLSEMLDTNGQAPRAFRGYGLRGTETHMAPEVAKGDARGAKADVWSSCCMLLHMLNGCHPWTRYYAHPLCLTIVSEEPPLREVPGSCHPLTALVFRAGLVKDPGRRASATELKERSSDALRAVGGVSSTITYPPTHPPVEPSAEAKIPPAPECPSATSQEAPPPPRGCDITSCCGDSPQPLVHWLSTWRERAQEEEGSDSEDGERHSEEEWSEVEGRREKWEEEESEEEEGSDLESLRGKASDWMEEEEEWEPFHRLQILYGPKQHTHTHSHTPSHTDQTESEEEALMKGPGLNSVSLPRPPRSQNRALIPLNTSEHQFDSSEKESDWSDDLSSGVFSSYNSQTDRENFSVDWLVSTNQPPSCCIEGLGVDIWIEDFSGERFRIRERPQVKVGHVAMGISDQISVRMFSLATLDGKLVRPEEEVQESGTWLQCVPALDDCPAWTWRIRDGQLEERR